jgi:hypothetical protein
MIRLFHIIYNPPIHTFFINQQLTVYKCLIRSTMEYAPIITLSSEPGVEKLSGIQYQALKIISKERGQVSNTFLHDLFSIQTK